MTTTEDPVSTTSSTAKFVYRFGDGHADGSADMRNLLGGMDAWKRLERPMETGPSEHSVTTPDVEGLRQ